MAQTLKPVGLKYKNVETWRFPYGKKVPVVFISNNDEDGSGFDPTGTTENKDMPVFLMTFTMLVDELSAQDKKMGKMIKLIVVRYQKKKILAKVDLGKGKSQGYKYIAKVQKLTKGLYCKNYK